MWCSGGDNGVASIADYRHPAQHPSDIMLHVQARINVLFDCIPAARKRRQTRLIPSTERLEDRVLLSVSFQQWSTIDDANGQTYSKEIKQGIEYLTTIAPISNSAHNSATDPTTGGTVSYAVSVNSALAGASATSGSAAISGSLTASSFLAAPTGIVVNPGVSFDGNYQVWVVSDNNTSININYNNINSYIDLQFYNPNTLSESEQTLNNSGNYTNIMPKGEICYIRVDVGGLVDANPVMNGSIYPGANFFATSSFSWQLGSPDLAVTSAALSPDGEKVNAMYTITGGNLASPGTIDFYWATGPNLSEKLGATPAVKVGTATQASSTAYTASTSIASMGQEPTNATYILAVADSPSADPNHDVVAVALSTPPPPPPSLSGAFTAYRPVLSADSHVTASANINFHDYPIPESEEDSRGVGVRIDGEDNGPSHIVQTGQPDLDLLEVDVHVGVPSPSGFHYVLLRDDPDIKVWGEQSKQTAILDSNSALLSFSSPAKVLWVEWSGSRQGVASLSLLAVNDATGQAIRLDNIKFHTFSSVVLVFSGETSLDSPRGIDPTFGPMINVFLYYYEIGYDAHIFVPLDSPNRTLFGEGPAYAEVSSAVKSRAVTQLAIVGYSHGGGATYSLAKAVDATNLLPAGVSISFSAYIDAIDNTHVLSRGAERHRPPGSMYFLNIYQPHRQGRHGVSIRSANQNILKQNLNHSSIVRDKDVQHAVEEGLSSRVQI
jgi:hypothetical protein